MTSTVECPQCGKNMELTFVEDRHQVHNGIGMQTVAVDRYVEYEGECECELTGDEIEQMKEEAADDYYQAEQDYYEDQYDYMKDEGLL